jgi:4-hydroxythreonine-4-phosphate dehydrogenase
VPKIIAISVGDVCGIGPEVTLKALSVEIGSDDTRYILVGPFDLLQKLNESFGLKVPLSRDPSADVSVYEPKDIAPVANPPGNAAAAKAAMAFLKAGAQLCLAQKAAALVTAPVNKSAIINAGFDNFVGQTEYLSSLAGTSETAMMLLGSDDRGRWLRVALATTHLPLRAVSEKLTRDGIERAITLAARACNQLQLPRARVAVCGLNPHAGEEGKLGDEEQKVIAPAVRACQDKGLDVAGPFPADALFYYVLRGDYDAVVAMYHDQGLVPLKMIGFERGVNWTLGLPFVRTSPDHGTAYDIAQNGIANPSSMIEAIRLAKRLTDGN